MKHSGKKKKGWIVLLVLAVIVILVAVGVIAQWPHPEIVPMGETVTVSPESDEESSGWLHLYYAGFGWKSGSMEFTATGVNTFDTYEAAGISTSDLSGAYSDGHIPADSKLVVVGLSVKNVDAEPERNPSVDPFFSIGMVRITEPAYFDGLTALGFSSNGGKYAELNGQIAYFSHHAAAAEEGPTSPYFHFWLDSGETMDCKVAWWIPKDMVENQDMILKIGVSNMYKYGIRLQ